MQEHYIKAFLAGLTRDKGVYIAPGYDAMSDFERKYIALRKLEKRIYTDDELQLLPFIKDHPHAGEWKLRARSFNRVNRYFKNKPEADYLDLGCGNGWFTDKLSSITSGVVLGVDVNMTELRQAARVFNKDKLDFIAGDIFNLEIPPCSMDFIILNASVQYFSDLKQLVERLTVFLKTEGEIHFIDSPFYTTGECKAALERTQEYYSKAGFPEMAGHYFHHTWEELAAFDFQVLYKPIKRSRILQKLIIPDIPFPWIRIMK